MHRQMSVDTADAIADDVILFQTGASVDAADTAAGFRASFLGNGHFPYHPEKVVVSLEKFANLRHFASPSAAILP